MSNPSAGGRYVIDKDGKRAKREVGTEPHPEGARARGAKGERLNRAAAAAAVQEAPIVTKGSKD